MNLLAIAAYAIDRLRYWGGIEDHLVLDEPGEGITIGFEGTQSWRGGVVWRITGVKVDIAALGFVN